MPTGQMMKSSYSFLNGVLRLKILRFETLADIFYRISLPAFPTPIRADFTVFFEHNSDFPYKDEILLSLERITVHIIKKEKGQVFSIVLA